MNTKSFHSVDDVVIVEHDGNDLVMKLCSSGGSSSDWTNEKICSSESKITV